MRYEERGAKMDKEAEQVWNHAFGNVAKKRDECGAIVRKNKHGNTQSPYGWTIDHIDPHGGNGLDNKQPLHWLNNQAKANKTNWKCAVKARRADDGEWHNYDVRTGEWL